MYLFIRLGLGLLPPPPRHPAPCIYIGLAADQAWGVIAMLRECT